MQFDQAGTLIVPVRFYFAPSTAKPIDGPHLFGTDYFIPHTNVGLGPGLRWDSQSVYDKGAPPPGIDGTHEPCGPADWWINGVPSDAPPLIVDGLGRSICCGPSNSFTDTLGIAVGIENTVCQPWHVFGPPTRSLRDLTSGVNWVPTINTTNQYFAHDPGATTHTLNFTHGIQVCLGFDKTNPVTLVQGAGHPNVTLTLLSWNPVNGAGYYQVPPGTFFYSGHIFRFINPV